MLRNMFALVVAGALLSGAALAEPLQSPARSEPRTLVGPLAAGGAAGIKQAQGAQRDRIWDFAPFGLVGGLALLIVLTGEDDESVPATTGSN